MTPIDRLLQIMARLRDPELGCPWDREQSYESILPHTIEEAYEVADAIERGDRDELRDELGDLLFQVVFYAQIAREEGAFEFADVVAGIADKLVRRHPHVFGGDRIGSAAEQTRAWEAHKAAERADRAEPGRPPSVLDGVPLALPALTRAGKLQKRAANVGFDWPQATEVLDKIEEEAGELRAELQDADRERLTEEIGDLLFACVNLSRHLEIDPETALRVANRKFEQRFRQIEALVAEQGRAPAELELAELDALWEQVKRHERGG
jgi:nucleoside triphosphate diphosphatase